MVKPVSVLAYLTPEPPRKLPQWIEKTLGSSFEYTARLCLYPEDKMDEQTELQCHVHGTSLSIVL